MPTLGQVYWNYQYGEFARRTGRWMDQAAYPWRLGDVRFYMEANYITMDTYVLVRTDLLPDMPVRFTIKSEDVLNFDEYELSALVVEAFMRQFRSVHILPEDHIELGEN